MKLSYCRPGTVIEEQFIGSIVPARIDRHGAADRGQRGEAAGVIAEAMRNGGDLAELLE